MSERRVTYPAWTPAALYGPPRRWLTPVMAGRSRRSHIALTFDDGPDPVSTPLFVDLLAQFGIRATFFLIGERARAYPDTVRLLAERGHEIAVHGWTHRCVATLRSGRLTDEICRSGDLVAELSGRAPRWYRPPYGITTVGATRAARAAGLQPLLWTAWGRDWSRRAGTDSVVRTVGRTLTPGGTVLLHDTDAYSAAGSWRTTLAATEALLEGWSAEGLAVGPVSEHGLKPAR